jgi:hypothetical protein
MGGYRIRAAVPSPFHVHGLQCSISSNDPLTKYIGYGTIACKLQNPWVYSDGIYNILSTTLQRSLVRRGQMALSSLMPKELTRLSLTRKEQSENDDASDTPYNVERSGLR